MSNIQLIMWSQHDSLREKELLLSESTFGMCNVIFLNSFLYK